MHEGSKGRAAYTSWKVGVAGQRKARPGRAGALGEKTLTGTSPGKDMAEFGCRSFKLCSEVKLSLGKEY